MKLRVMTYNIASGRDYGVDLENEAAEYNMGYDVTKCAEVIREATPVICGLNEINEFDMDEETANQPLYIGKTANLPYTYFSKTLDLVYKPDVVKKPSKEVPLFDKDSNGILRRYGNAVASKYPIISAETIPVSDPEIFDENVYYESRAIAKVKLDVAGGITVFQTHFGLAVSEAQNSVTTLCKLIDETEGPIILMGDFNVRPSNFILNPIRERLVDTASVRPGEYIKTFPSYPVEYPDCKIDYMFVSKHFKVNSVEVPQLRVSDHYPYIAELEI